MVRMPHDLRRAGAELPRGCMAAISYESMSVEHYHRSVLAVAGLEESEKPVTCEARCSNKSRVGVGPRHSRSEKISPHPVPQRKAAAVDLHQRRIGAGLLRPAAMDRDGRQGWVPTIGFAFLSFNCGVAVYRSWDDPYAVAFVVTAYAALVLLFRCLHLVERRRDQRLKLAVWGLCTLLTLMFSYKVAAILPPWAQLLVWVPGIITIVAGFYAFFIARLEEP